MNVSSKANYSIRISSFKLIQIAVNEKWIKQLAFWYLLKVNYKNSCIYNYKSRMKELSVCFNISLQTLYSYIKVLREKNLLYDHKSNLILKSTYTIKAELKDRKKCKIQVNWYDKIYDLECKLYAKLIERHVRKIAFNESIRRYNSRELYKVETIENEFCPSFSIRNIAKLICVDKNKAYRVLKKLKELRIIKTEIQKPIKLCNNATGCKPEYFADVIGYHFVYNNSLYQQFGSKIQCLQYPVYIKNISKKAYLRYCKLRLSKNKDNL